MQDNSSPVEENREEEKTHLSCVWKWSRFEER